jgi:hypothetical protein
MATITPAYSWPVPTSTDLVTNGATAIEALGDAIDASMNTALGTKKAGMVLVNETSFTGVASQSVNDVFSATYENYRIVFNMVSSNHTSQLGLRLRVAGIDNSSSEYDYAFVGHTPAGSSYSGAGNPTTSFNQILRFTASGSLNTAGHCDIFRPFETFKTVITSQTVYPNSSNSPQIQNYGGQIRVDTSYDGFSIITNNASTTLTGKIVVYAYNL